MIEVKNLCKDYGTQRAVDTLNFTIEPGHVYGFLGPNGAGKSTTMNILTGCLAASSGQVLIGGFDIFEEPAEAKSLIGYLPEQPPLYQEMTVCEYLKFVAAAKCVPKSEVNGQLNAIMEVTQLSDVSERIIKNLSKGYRQRVGIAQALTGNPQIVILDEPTVGLDPKQIIEIRELIRQLGKEHTVILSSHILSEVRSVCDRLLIISKGRLVAEDTPEGLEEKYAPMSFEEIFLELTGEMSEEQAQAIADGQLLASDAVTVSATAQADTVQEEKKEVSEGESDISERA